MKPIVLALAALLALARSGAAETPMTGGTRGTLSWKAEKETRTPEPEYTKRGGIVGKVGEVAEKIEKVGQGGIVKETYTARLALAFKVRVIRHAQGFDLKLRWREDSWSISPNTPGDYAAGLEGDRAGLAARLSAWERSATREERAKLEKGEAIQVSIADAYAGVSMLAGEPPKLEARWGAYEITGFSVRDESHENRKALEEKVKAAEAKLADAAKKHEAELEKLTKLSVESEAAKMKAAEKKFELERAKLRRDSDPEARKKQAEIDHVGRELTDILTSLGKDRDRIAKLKKNIGLKPDASEEEFLKALPPESEIATTIRRRNELQARIVALGKEMEDLKAKLNPKYGIDRLEADYASLLKAIGPEADLRKQTEAVHAAVTEVDARFQELADAKLEAEKARHRSPIRFNEVVVTGADGEIYRARVQTARELEDELAECEARLRHIRKEMDAVDASRAQVREDALEAGRKEIAARNSWTVWFHNSMSYFAQAAVAIGIEVSDVAKAARQGGAAGAAAEILKKAGERIVSGVVLGKWGEEYKDADWAKGLHGPDLDSKFARETAVMSSAKGLLGQTLEATGELPWEEFVKRSKFFHELKPHLSSLKEFKASAKTFAKESFKKAVGEMLVDGLIKDRIKDNLEQFLVNYFDQKAVAEYAEAEVRARAMTILWTRTVSHYWNCREAYLTQLKKRDAIARRLSERAFTDVLTSKRFLDGEPLTIRLGRVEESSTWARKVELTLGSREAIRSGKDLTAYEYRLDATDLNEECQGGVAMKAVIKE